MAENPEIPQYADNPPPANENCGGNGGNNGLNIVSPPQVGGGGGKDAEVLAGFSMLVNDLSDINTDRFEVNYDPYEAVAVSLGIIAKSSTVQKTNPILKGTNIDAVECLWSYNAARDADINAQTLVNSGAGANPTLLATDRGYNYSGLTITDDASVTVDGTDGRTSDDEVDNIIFGNYIAIGVANPSMLFQLPAAAQAIFDALSDKRIKTTQAGESFNAFGTDQEYMTIAHPESWGDSAFTKGSFTGGYQRIYKVNRGGDDMFVNEVLGGDVELDIVINNGNGFAENFYFYQSEFPERTGNEPTVISKI